MKRLFLIYLILVAFIFEANAQSEGDFRTRQSGNYSLNTTWQIYSSGSWVNAGSGVIPNTSDHNVTILSNHAVTLNGNYTIKQLVIESNGELNFLNDNSRTLTLISDLVVEANGLIQPSITPSGANRTCTIVIGGNALIDGITDAINYSASYESRLFFTFNGGADNTLSGSGTIGLYDLTINKGSDTTSTLSVNTTINLSAANATDEQRLTLSNGTLKLNAANAWIPYADNNKTVGQPASCLWLNNAFVDIKSADTISNTVTFGHVRIDAGQLGTSSSATFTESLIMNGSNLSLGNNLRINKEMHITNAVINAGGSFSLQETSITDNSITNSVLTFPTGFDIESKLIFYSGTLNSGAFFQIDGNSTGEKGEFIIHDGTINVGDGNDYLEVTYNGKYTQYSGEVYVYGRFATEDNATTPAIVNISGGNIYIDSQKNTNLANNVSQFYISTNTPINFTGGHLWFINPHADKSSTNIRAFYIQGTTGTRNFIGSTIHFGDGIDTKNGDDTYPGFCVRVESDITLDNIIIDNPHGIRRFVYLNGADLTVNNLTLTNPNDTLSINGRILKINEHITNHGVISGAVAASKLHFTGSMGQNITGSGTISGKFSEVSFNNTSTSGVNIDFALNADVVAILDGIVHNTQEIKVSGTSVTSLTGGSATEYFTGPITRTFPPNLSNATYAFPVGESSYQLFELVGISRTDTLGNTGTITIDLNEGITTGVGGDGVRDPINSTDVYWQITTSMGARASYNIDKIRLTENYSYPPLRVLAMATDAHIGGTYYGIGGTYDSGSSTTLSDLFNETNLTPSGTGYIIIAEIEPLNGTYTVGATGDFFNLTAVSDILREKIVDDYVKFELQADYDPNTETLPIVFDVVSTSLPEYFVTIRPGVSGIVAALAGNPNESVIQLKGVQKLVFDGRVGGIGAADLTIANTNNIDAGPVFEFSNDAYTDTLKYINIEGANTSLQSGIIVIANGVTVGNDNIVISNCLISDYSGNLPVNGIYSSASASFTNNNIYITNNEIFNFWNADTSSCAIYVGNNTSDWTITGNKIYQTNTRTHTGDGVYCGIWVNNNSGQNYIISQNVIGFADASANGYTIVGGGTLIFRGIRVNTNTSGSSLITSNQIAGIQFSTGSTATGNGYFNGILVENGFYTVGGGILAGNKIGTSGAFADYSIQITQLAGGAGYIQPIYVTSANTVNISYNQIGSIRTIGNFNTIMFPIRLYNTSTSALHTVANNIIGSQTTANSILMGDASYTTTYVRFVGIHNDASATPGITNNTIANITLSNINNSGNYYLQGIFQDYRSATITGNSIYNLSTASSNTNTTTTQSIIGIYKNSTNVGDIIENNLIHSLQNINPNNVATSICGIYWVGGTLSSSSISRNKTYSLYNNSNSGTIYGIYIRDGYANVMNNMVNLGNDSDGNSITASATIYGLYHYSDDNSNFIYNSVYIGGDNVAAGTKNTYAYYKRETNMADILNNILVNARSNTSGTGLNYAVHIPSFTAVNCNYNIYYVSGLGGTLAHIASTDLTTLQMVRSVSDAKDLQSGVGNPYFISPVAPVSAIDMKLQAITPAEGMGIVVNSITEDIDGSGNRSGVDYDATDIGADEGIHTFDASVDIFTPIFVYSPIDNIAAPGDVSVNVTIKEKGVGIDLGSNHPRVYFRRSTINGGAGESWSTAMYTEGTYVSGTATESVWSFTIPAAAFTSPALGNKDIVDYYFVAQDLASTPNINYSKYNATSPIHTTVADAAPTFPSIYQIDVYGVGITMAGNYNIPTDFTSLTGTDGFFYKLNAAFLTDNVTLSISTDLVETAIYSLHELSELPAASNFSVYIVPADASVKYIWSSESKKMIRFDGADRIIIDGRYSGSGNYLTFQHTLNNQPVFQFVNSATYDTIKYCTIEGSNNLNPSGTILFDTITSGIGYGNDYNAIINNTIKNFSSAPLNIIYSLGNEIYPNDSNTVSGNIMHEFRQNGIWVNATGNGNGWVISDNTMYNTIVNDTMQTAIRIEAGSNHKISGNRIGGNNANNDGSWTNDGTGDFYAIYLDADDSLVSDISGNLITNITLSSTANGSATRFIGVLNGKTNIANNVIRNIVHNRGNNVTSIYSLGGDAPFQVTSNTIDSITITSNYDFYPVYLDMNSTTQMSVNANTISNIRLTGSGSDFMGLNLLNGNFECDGNQFGGFTPGDSILITNGFFQGVYISSANSAGSIDNNIFCNIHLKGDTTFNGIYTNNTDDVTLFDISGNQFGNIILSNTGAKNTFRGIYVRDGLVNVANNQIGIIGPISLSGTSRAFGIIADNSFESNSYISNNIIKNISGQGAVFGIYTYRNVTHYIQNNDFTNWIFADNTLLSPIRVGSGTIYINGNNLSGIQLINTGANTQFYGIYANGGTVYISNTSANIFGTLADPIINNGTGYTSLLYKSGGTVTITNQDFEYVNGNAKVSVIRNEAGTITFTNCSLQNLNLNTGSDLAGIDLTGGSLVMQGTSISGVNITSPSATAFSAISLANNSTATLGTTTSNTISNISSSLDIPLRGIWYNSSGTSTISSNSIFSITSSSTGTNAYVVGIEHTGTGNVTMQYNTIHTLNSSSERIISNLPHAAQALYVNSASISPVSRNLIYEIQSVGTVSNFASGVVWGSANSTFFNNTIHTIRNTSSGSGTIANGIHIYSPTSAAGIYNNMILMGEDGENPEYAGIRVSDASVSDANIYFNSVFISGAGSASNLSHAFIRESGSLPVNLVNNILVNLRTGSSTHYAVSNLNTADWNSNTNCYYTTDDTHTTNWNGLALNLDDWTSTVSNDTASVYFNPDFVDESAADLRLETNANCMLNGIAITISGITNDIDGDTRVHSPTPSDIGVDDFTPTGGWGDDVWRGFASTDWATANNWSCENVPTAASNVTINRATNYPIIASAANISITDLTINSGGRLSISSAALLNVSGDIVNNGNLYIQSTLTQTGSLLNDGNITGSGLCTFNRLLSGGEFHYISSPVSNASHTIFSTYGEDHNYTNPNFYLYDDNKPLVDNWLQGWDSLTCRTSDIEVGRGYAHWYTYQATYGIRGNLFNTGNQTISVTNSNKGYASDGFNLIGNPYPSAIDAQEFIDLNATINGTIDGTLYFWDDDLSNGAGYNTSDYATWNVVGVAGAGGVAPNGYIAPTQGFFVYKSTPGIANIEFNNIMRVSNAPVLFKNKESIGRIYLTVQSPNMQTNEILVAFTSLATDKFDRMYDSPKLRGNQNLALYSLLNSYELAIQSIGELSLADTLRTIPLGIENTMSGEYQFSAYIENLPAWANVYLEDRVTGLKNLLGNEPVYIKLPEGKIDNRFRIIFANRPLSNASETPIMEENNFKIYAFGDKVYVKMPLTELQTGTLNVYNSLGQMISTMNYTDVNFIEAPLFVNRGVYLIEWQTLTNKISSKVSIR